MTTQDLSLRNAHSPHHLPANPTQVFPEPVSAPNAPVNVSPPVQHQQPFVENDRPAPNSEERRRHVRMTLSRPAVKSTPKMVEIGVGPFLIETDATGIWTVDTGSPYTRKHLVEKRDEIGPLSTLLNPNQLPGLNQALSGFELSGGDINAATDLSRFLENFLASCLFHLPDRPLLLIESGDCESQFSRYFGRLLSGPNLAVYRAGGNPDDLRRAASLGYGVIIEHGEHLTMGEADLLVEIMDGLVMEMPGGTDERRNFLIPDCVLMVLGTTFRSLQNGLPRLANRAISLSVACNRELSNTQILALAKQYRASVLCSLGNRLEEFEQRLEQRRDLFDVDLDNHDFTTTERLWDFMRVIANDDAFVTRVKRHVQP